MTNILMMKSLGDQSRSTVRMVTIQEDQAGQRIDNFLITELKGVPRSLIYRILRKGEVRVNKRRIKPQYRIQCGDIIRLPPLREAHAAEKPAPHDKLLTSLKQSIIYQDAGLLVINKPSGVAVHGGSGISYGVIEGLRAALDLPYLELVHRLDRDTSGCLMIAKKRSVLRQLHTLLRTGQVSKNYLALVKGRWQGGKRSIRMTLKKNVLSSGERVVRVSEGGKSTLSVFSPQAFYSNATLMSVSLKTGRTHQIRVQAAESGHPLAGDSKYGDAAFNRTLREYGLRRLFLHAAELGFTLPEDSQRIVVKAPLPDDLMQVLQALEKRQI
jgi:23S rRNA pseudouridine955/2504/2580 synthase